MKLMKNKVKNEDGQVLVLVALLMVVLIGFAALLIDVGMMYLTKANMQNAADAAAIAGAQKLSSSESTAISNAINAALDYAGKNGMKATQNGFMKDGDTVTVTTPYKSDPYKIEVVCTRTVPFSFAKVLGFTQSDVTARAVAKINLPSAFDYAIFSESADLPLSVGKAGQSKITGAIHTNNTLYLGKHLDVTRVEASSGIFQTGSNTIGSSDDHAPNITIPTDFKTALLAQVTSAPKKYTGNQIFSNSLDLSQSVYVQGDVTITGNNLTGKGFIYATGSITISGNNTQIGSAADPVFIYSEKNITILANNPKMYCIIYAPNGIIDVQKNNWNLYGRLIGKSFAEDCLKNGFNITAGSGDFGGVPLGGVTSGLVE